MFCHITFDVELVATGSEELGANRADSVDGGDGESIEEAESPGGSQRRTHLDEVICVI